MPMDEMYVSVQAGGGVSRMDRRHRFATVDCHRVTDDGSEMR